MVSTVSSSKPSALQIDPLGLEPIPDNTYQRFLRFNLSGESRTLLPLTDIAEVRQLEIAEILPIPEVSSCVLGVCNWRGEILWLVDLNVLVGDDSLWQQNPLIEQPVVMVVQSNQQSVGLVISQVEDVELVEPESIHPQTDVGPTAWGPFIVGYLPDHRGVVLDATAIVERSLRNPY